MDNITTVKQDSIIMPLLRLFLLLLLTLTLYTPVWCYRKWKYIKETKNKKIRPLLLALLSGVPFVNAILQYSLFKELFEICTNWNKKTIYFSAFSLSCLWFAILYIIFIYKNINSSLMFSTLFYIIPILIVQAILNKKGKT